jgi:hypothetical protein
MSDVPATKVCPSCAEQIKARAKKCPFCNSYLGFGAIFLSEVTLGLSALSCIGGMIFLCVSIFPPTHDPGGRSFAGHRNDLKTTNLRVEIEKRGTSGFYYNVSGFVTNQSPHPWRVRQFELTVSNAIGAPDIVHEEIKNGFVVQPCTEHSFVFNCWAGMTNPITTSVLRVENAEDGTLPSLASE